MRLRHDHLRSAGLRETRDFEVDARERLSMGQGYVRGCGVSRAPQDPAVDERERLPVGLEDERVRDKERTPRTTKLGHRERLSSTISTMR